VRVAALKDQVAAGITTPTADGRTPAQTLREVGDVVERLVAAQEALLHGELLPALSGKGIELVRYADLDEVERKFVAEVFEHRMFPVLTPLAVDPAHPLP
jgi:polyphosphate kinase